MDGKSVASAFSTRHPISGSAHGIAAFRDGGGPYYSYRTRRDRRRPDGIASTMRHSPIITIPINSKAKASTAILPDKPLELRGAR